MAQNLVIVESPAKAATIERYLGVEYQVLASFGHVRDLPASKLGVDPEDKFTPTYVIPPSARKALTALKAALKGKQTVYLATDLDREGEAIAWHIQEALGLRKISGLDIKRITFDEITKPALTYAVAHPRMLNTQLIDAQQARRSLDRLVGYTLSPVLWKALYRGLSAGRVQSVAMRLVVDRERERQAFTAVEYWSITAALLAENVSFVAKLVEFRGKKIEQLTLSNQIEADAILTEITGQAFIVRGVEAKEQKRHPQPPYTTSKLQQEGASKLGLSAKRTMMAAQRLYERGAITYMRTDSVNISQEALAAVRVEISNHYGVEYLPTSPNRYTTKSKGAQEAHEAIRPTNPGQSAESVANDPIEQKVYDLIRRKALASQMADARIEQTAVSIQAGVSLFRATGQRILFPGFLAAWGKEESETQLPGLKSGQELKVERLIPEQHFTEPPPRFTEGTIVKALEEFGIGRPSTYAPTIATLIDRGYVKVEQRQIVPEEIGFTVTDLLKEHFPQVVDTGFTAQMEEGLDEVAEGKTAYAEVLGQFWGPFKENVDAQTLLIKKVEITEVTDQLCPLCQSSMTVKVSRFGKFLACGRFPECKGSRPMEEPASTGLICPRSGHPFIEKKGKRVTFFGCSAYPECQTALWEREQLPAKVAELEGEGVELPFKEQALAAFSLLGLEPKALRLKREVAVKKPAPRKRKVITKRT